MNFFEFAARGRKLSSDPKPWVREPDPADLRAALVRLGLDAELEALA